MPDKTCLFIQWFPKELKTRAFKNSNQAGHGRQALDLCLKLMPDVLVTDIEMPEMTGLEVAAAVKKRPFPEPTS